MKLLDADVIIRVEPDRTLIRIEATERAAAFLFALDIPFKYIDPSEDSGRPWYEFEYSQVIDDRLVDLVEWSAEMRERQPGFGQLELAL